MEKTLFIFLINVLISSARNRLSSGQPLDKSINLVLDVERRIVDIEKRIADIEIDIQSTPSSKVPEGLEYRVNPRPNGGLNDELSTCQTKACLKASDDTLALMNTSVDPCEDFYQYSCGGFNQVTYKFDLNCK